MERRREEKGVSDGDQGCEEGADDVKAYDGAHGSAGVSVLLRHGVHDEHGRDALERFDKEIAEDGDRRYDLWHGDGNDDTEHETDGDEFNQGSFLIFSADRA